MNEESKAILLRAAGWIVATANSENATEAKHLSNNLRDIAGDMNSRERHYERLMKLSLLLSRDMAMSGTPWARELERRRRDCWKDYMLVFEGSSSVE